MCEGKGLGVFKQFRSNSFTICRSLLSVASFERHDATGTYPSLWKVAPFTERHITNGYEDDLPLT